MKNKKVMSLSLAGLVLILCVLAIWCFVVTGKTDPHNSHSEDVDVDVQGDVYQISDIEEELTEIIEKFELGKIENVTINNVEYIFESDETGYAHFSFSFNNIEKDYSYFWNKITLQDLKGLAELWISLPDAKVYHITYNYGVMDGDADSEPLEEIKKIKINEFYLNLIKDDKYLESINNEPNVIRIKLTKDKIEATSNSVDGNKILHKFE